MKSSNQRVVDQLQRVVNKILFLKKGSLFQFNGVSFYPSEIHLMLVIRKGNSTNATKIAGELGVTKGAVSQTLTRLEKKGVLTKVKDPHYKNELTLIFTPFGTEALMHYSQIAADISKKHHRYLKNFSEPEKNAIQRFLVEVEKVFETM